MKITLRPFLQLFTLAVAMIALQSTPLRADEVFNGREFLAYDLQVKVKEPRVIERTPIYDAAPFLKLKKDNHLVVAKGWDTGGKGERPHFNDFESYFLKSGEKYYRLGWGSDKPDFPSSYQSLLFDWDVTLANAKVLSELDKPDEPLVIEKFASLKNALRKDFPETLRDVGNVKFDAPRLVGKGKTRRVIFRVLAFSRSSNIVFVDQLEVGNGIHITYRKNLIIGPRRVKREEFEGYENNGQPNGTGAYTPDPETAAKARAAYNRSTKFQSIVNKFLIHPPMGEG